MPPISSAASSTSSTSFSKDHLHDDDDDDDDGQLHAVGNNPVSPRVPSGASSSTSRAAAATAAVEAARAEREARSIAIEKAYVHDVYEQISHHVSDSRYRAWPRVKQFLQELEPGSLVCDVGESTLNEHSYSY